VFQSEIPLVEDDDLEIDEDEEITYNMNLELDDLREGLSFFFFC